ncbi:MAG TPA: FAD-dependent oxidoreductase [Streptosporangiaceae bacterium]
MRLIVVGTGITGSACGYAASVLGADVVLVDCGRPGRATAAGAGIICPWSSAGEDPDRFAFGCAGARAYPALIAALGEEGETALGYRRSGALLLASGTGRQQEMVRDLAARQDEWPQMGEISPLDPAQAQELFPPLAPGRPAVHIGGGARVDGRLISAALRRAAGRHGASVISGEARLRCARSAVTGVTVAGEFIAADAVVAATGAWTDTFLEPAGLALGVTAQRGQIVHIGLGLADTSRWPVILPGGSGHYLLAFDDSRVVAGATRETGSGLDYRVTPGGLAEVLGEALSVAPGLASGTYLETRVGFRPVGPGDRPLLGPVPGVAGLFVATGLGATGLTMGPYAGELTARAALGLDLPSHLRPFIPAGAEPGGTEPGGPLGGSTQDD